MVKSALGWESISNTLAGPSTPGTAYGLLHEAASGARAAASGGGSCAAGMGTVTALMADAAREAGAEIRTGAEVARCGSPAAVRPVSCSPAARRSRRARAVQRGSQAHVPRTGRRGATCRPDFVGSLRAYRCEGASLKINLAVAELPRVRGVDGDGAACSRTTAGSSRSRSRSPTSTSTRRRAQAGMPAEAAHMELCIPTRARSVARAGGHARRDDRRPIAAVPARATRRGTTSRRTWRIASSPISATFVPRTSPGRSCTARS